MSKKEFPNAFRRSGAYPKRLMYPQQVLHAAPNPDTMQAA
jgi:hypothetical protein